MPDQDPTLKVKQREPSFGRFTGRSNVFSNWGGTWTEYPGTLTDFAVTGKQITASQGHPWRGFPHYQGFDNGGPFETTKYYLASDELGENPISMEYFAKYNLVKQQDAFGGYVYRGQFLPMLFNLSSWPQPEPSSDYELMAHGTTAIARVKPTNSVANLSVALAELMREGLPKFPGRSQWEERAKVARGAGSEYLNAQFGWLPLISDIQDVAKAISQGDKIWKQYERDAGKLVRRRYEFKMSKPDPQVIATSSGAYAYPILPSYYYPPGFTGGTFTRTRHKRQERWFSGAFTYTIPDRNSAGALRGMSYAASKARKLYGLTLDPEVLWNLTPWSWATDWFLNTGDVISNLSDWASDGLLMPFGYMMETTIVADELKLEGLQWATSPPGPSSLKVFLVTKTKKRIRASPYGFGLTFEDFSPRQLAIMASLGITRYT